ncbi:hypothetical protein V7122_12670 [Bacillus sp. JJ1532]|uniref:hypothetical protein n=1 Tax=unclassified Bacillus (in: firmicutes) TaxID=185979 RepID=UPI002FFEB94A
MGNQNTFITREMVANYNELNRRKKEIEMQLDELKKAFNQYFDMAFGINAKGELTIDDYKLQRQIRITEKYEQEATVHRLEELNLMDLIQKKPDEAKIKSALNLGFLKDEDLEGCIIKNTSQALYVKYADSK